MSGYCSAHKHHDSDCKQCNTSLLPCPFCGGTDLNTSYTNGIYCKNINCGGSIDGGAPFYQDGKDVTKEFVIDCWNTRVTNKDGV